MTHIKSIGFHCQIVYEDGHEEFKFLTISEEDDFFWTTFYHAIQQLEEEKELQEPK